MLTSTKSWPADPGNPPVPSGGLAEESALVDAAQRGDLAAFGQIYQRYFNQIYDFAARVTRSARMAEEVTAETFIRMADQIGGMEGRSQLRVAIYTIAGKLAADRSAGPIATDGLEEAATGADPEYSTLVWEGAVLLGSRTYAAVDLIARRGLSDLEAGVVAGIRQEIAAETIARTRERSEQAMAIFVLVKGQVGSCAALRTVVGAHASASLGRDLVDVVISHLEECVGCGRAWQQIPPPLAVLGKLAVMTPAHGFRDMAWALARRRYRWAGPGSSTRRTRVASVAALVAFVLGVATAVTIGGDRVADAGVTASPNHTVSRLALSSVDPVTETTTTTTSTVPTRPAPVAASRATTTTAVPSEPPFLGIITPVEGQQLTSSSELTFVDLVAVVQDDIDEGLVVRWNNGPTYLGSGNGITAALATGCPDASSHAITASVTDSSGGTSTATVTFTILCESPDG